MLLNRRDAQAELFRYLGRRQAVDFSQGKYLSASRWQIADELHQQLHFVPSLNDLLWPRPIIRKMIDDRMVRGDDRYDLAATIGLERLVAQHAHTIGGRVFYGAPSGEGNQSGKGVMDEIFRFVRIAAGQPEGGLVQAWLEREHLLAKPLSSQLIF